MDNRKKVRMNGYKGAEKQRLVCDCEDLLPYAWRTPPVIKGKRCSKVLRDMAQAEELRNMPPSAKK